jgi:hypothetical protein
LFITERTRARRYFGGKGNERNNEKVLDHERSPRSEIRSIS